ncbi:GntR family transcriptional regulator [Leifsonia sp. NPDC058292]|uniref:GntR family transcriptional regulator n=1 Tax=Leifsonia sp. NPDC058292 TaxID=3346428 RepID=UPI0036DB6008
MAEQHTKSERLRQHLVDVIDQGLEPHSKLPAERDLATEFDVSRLTVRRALDRLEHDGLVYRVQGAGTFVAAPRITKSVELTSFSEDMRARGLEPGSSILASETIAAGARLGAKLRVSPSDELFHIRRARTADGEPMALEDSYLNPKLFPGLIDNVGEESLYKILETEYGMRIEWAEQSIHASVLEPDEAAILHAPAFSPAFYVTRTSFDAKDRAVEYAESTYRGDRYHYELQIHRSR